MCRTHIWSSDHTLYPYMVIRSPCPEGPLHASPQRPLGNPHPNHHPDPNTHPNLNPNANAYPNPNGRPSSTSWGCSAAIRWPSSSTRRGGSHTGPGESGSSSSRTLSSSTRITLERKKRSSTSAWLWCTTRSAPMMETKRRLNSSCRNPNPIRNPNPVPNPNPKFPNPKVPNSNLE